jgi:selenocysteine lyase/cysteine desulfurase
MKLSKRKFIQSMAISSLMPFQLKANSIFNLEELPDYSKEFKDDWQLIRSHYELKKEYINLENGYFSIMSQPVLNAYLADIKKINREGSYYMRTVQFENKQSAKNRLSQLVGCASEEIIITRNTTESLDTVISGIDWKQGDEAVMAEQDYGSMLDMFKQQAKRYGIVNKIVSIPLHPVSDEEIVDLYAKAIGPKTRLLMACHMINISGQILPIKKICDMAHSKGVEVMVDGAHAIAHINFKISDLGCDYYGSSLHKWLGCPLGAGLLYVNKNRIQHLWPIYGEYNYSETQIEKLNHTGTHPVHTDLAINYAIDYHNWIGPKKKEARLRYLQNYWTSKLQGTKHILINTPLAAEKSCAIANVGIQGLAASELAKTLLNKYKIWTVAIDHANVHGVRITPHLYTTEKELDALVNALIEISKAQTH